MEYVVSVTDFVNDDSPDKLIVLLTKEQVLELISSLASGLRGEGAEFDKFAVYLSGTLAGMEAVAHGGYMMV